MELLIKNAMIIDGTGAPAYKGNIGVEDGKIKVECSEYYVTSLYARYRLVKKYRVIIHKSVLEQMKRK